MNVKNLPYLLKSINPPVLNVMPVEMLQTLYFVPFGTLFLVEGVWVRSSVIIFRLLNLLINQISHSVT